MYLAFSAGRDCLFVADTFNTRIRKVNLATLTVSTVAGLKHPAWLMRDGPVAQARMSVVAGLAYDDDHDCLYFCDQGNHRIRKIEFATQTVSTVAGTGQGFRDYGHQDGPVAQSQIHTPSALALDVDNNCLYFGGGYACLRKIDLTAETVSTIAGTPGENGLLDGPAAQAKMGVTSSLALDRGQNCLYFCDHNNHCIRKLDLTTQTVTTVLGGSGQRCQDGPAVQASTDHPNDLVLDKARKCLYFTSEAGSEAGNIRKLDFVTQTVSTLTTTPKSNGIVLCSSGKCLYCADARPRGSIHRLMLPPPPPPHPPSPPPHLSALALQMESMVDNPDVSDVVFQVGERLIHANSGILRTRCEFFRSLLSGNFSEGNCSSLVNSSKRRRTDSAAAAPSPPVLNLSSSLASASAIAIQEVDPDAFLEVLRFCHSSRCLLTPDSCLTVLNLAMRFGLADMASLVQRQVASALDVTNVCSLLEEADRLQAIELRNKCIAFAQAHLQEVRHMPMYEELKNRQPALAIEILETHVDGSG
jgi:DNA-binding beta-propeller fold protein YncE